MLFWCVLVLDVVGCGDSWFGECIYYCGIGCWCDCFVIVVGQLEVGVVVWMWCQFDDCVCMYMVVSCDVVCDLL